MCNGVNELKLSPLMFLFKLIIVILIFPDTNTIGRTFYLCALYQNEASSSSMLRYGEYSPNNPQFRVVAAPYIGLGEYEQRKQLFSRQRKNDYLEHLSKVNFILWVFVGYAEIRLSLQTVSLINKISLFTFSLNSI